MNTLVVSCINIPLTYKAVVDALNMRVIVEYLFFLIK
jgi:hypothetical protein